MARPTFEEFVRGPLGAIARCPDRGHWSMWRADMPAAVRDVYGWEVV